MPYTVKKRKGGYAVVKKSTGKTVARPKNMRGVRGYIWHAEHADAAKYRGGNEPDVRRG